jgi:hypothetical protein
MVSESSGRNESERGNGLETEAPGAEPSFMRRRQHGSSQTHRSGETLWRGYSEHDDKDVLSNWRSPPRPAEKLAESVKVQGDALHVRILHPSTNQLLREHLRQRRGGYRIREEDHPKKMPLSTAQLLRRAEHAGTQIGKLCQLIYQRQAETGIRRILGMYSLIRKYGAAAVEDACATALDIGVYEYRFVRRYLERRPRPQMFLRQIEVSRSFQGLCSIVVHSAARNGSTATYEYARRLWLCESEHLCELGVEHPRRKQSRQSPVLETLRHNRVACLRFRRGECHMDCFAQSLRG